MSAKWLAVLFLLTLLTTVIELVRREQLTFKYALGWIMLSLSGLVLVIFDGLVCAVSKILGFALPSNFVFFTCVVAGIFEALFLTIFLCQQNARNDKLVQKVALLENEVEELKKKCH
jgi:hypothetical protein